MSTNNIRLKKETITGFVDRGSNFRIGEHNTFRADRWVSEYFNVRKHEADTASLPSAGSIKPEKGGDEITLTREANVGFVDRGNTFQPRAKGTMTAERWVSGYFNLRNASE